MHIMNELFLPEIENIEPRILSSHPQHAAPILIDRENGVAIEAIRVGLIVLKLVRVTFCAPVKVREALARRHPQSILPVSRKAAIRRPPVRGRCQDADTMGAKWVSREALSLSIIFHEPDDRGIGQHPQIADFVFIHALCAEAIPGCGSNLSRLLIQMEQTALANKPDLP